MFIVLTFKKKKHEKYFLKRGTIFAFSLPSAWKFFKGIEKNLNDKMFMQHLKCRLKDLMADNLNLLFVILVIRNLMKTDLGFAFSVMGH